MKKIGYYFFAWIYRICSLICPLNPHKIVLWNGHNHGLNGNLLEIYQRMQQMSTKYEFVILSKRDIFFTESDGQKKFPQMFRALWRFFVILPYHMATAQRVFLNDNFLPMGYMKTKRRNTQFVQLWHGAGAFKRFGLSTEKDPAVYQMVKQANQRITHLFVTSPQIIPYYEEAFAIDRSRIHATGIPVTDLYFDQKRMEKRRERVYSRYPEFIGKKLLLYAPTFRKEDWENQQLLEQFDVEKLHEILGEDWIILIKLHPKFPMEHIVQNDFCYNMTDYNDISDLYLVADYMITDYSSTVVEYVLLDKPVLFFAYDLERYDRGFYYDYEQNMPGAIAHNQQELYAYLQEKDNYAQKRHDFVKFQYDNMLGGSSERILELLDRDLC